MEGIDCCFSIHSLQSLISSLFFSFTISFSLVSLMLYILRMKPWCNCPLCHSYLTSNWSLKFPNLCDWYTHLLRLSPTETIHFHVLGNTITANPDNVEYILKTNFHNYPKGKPFSTILADLLGRGIFNVDGEPWHFQRKMASLELGSTSMRTHAFGIVAEEIRSRLIPLMSSVIADTTSATTIDLQDVFRRFAFDNICKVSFGLDPECLVLSLPISEFANAFDRASMLSARRAESPSPLLWRLKRLLNLGSEKQLREAVGLINALAGEVIRKRRASLGHQVGYVDLLSRFMGTVNDDRYLRDIVVSFLLAGRDTVASALTSIFYLLSKHPEVESKVEDEVDRVMASETHELVVPTFDQLRSMHYVHATLYEAMRLYPPVQFDSKFAAADDILPDGTFVRKGTRVTYHCYAMGRMECIWGKDWEEFRPERWLAHGLFSPESLCKYPVFHAGPRVCLGKEMALMEIKSVVTSIVRSFKIDLLNSESGGLRFVPGLTATVAGGLMVRVSKRGS